MGSVRVALAAPHPSALDAAAEIVRAGGGAVDAAIAAAAALAVAYPHQSSVGGDLVALAREGASGTVEAVLSVGAAPTGIDPEALRASGDRMPAGGSLSVTVPGVVDGWRTLSERWGRLPWADLFGPAVRLARTGAVATPGLVRAIANRAAVIDADPGLRSLVRPGGATLRVGDTFVQAALADTLEEIARQPRDFYDGPLAERIAAALAGFGSPMDAVDLASHQARVVPPLTAEIGGRRWSVAPPPTQGVALLATLLAAGESPRDLVRSARAAELRRDAHLADLGPAPVELADLHAFLDVGDLPPALSGTAKPAGDTVAVTAVDADGTTVSLISSVFQSFGSGLLDPGTGVLFHNRGSAFSLDPSHPAVVRPGVRPPHTLCPAVVEAPETVVALGCQGGRAQAWILSQVADGVVDADDLDAVLRRPRWVIGSRDLGLAAPGMKAEPGVPADAPEAAAELGLAVHRWSGPEDEAGHVQVARLRAGSLVAASDPRADGSAGLL